MINLKDKKERYLRLKSKRALSEIVSYVLIIVIAISLAAGVYVWLKVYIPSKQADTCPKEASLFINDYSCSTSQKILTLKIENSGMFNIDGFFIKATNDSKIIPYIALKSNDASPGTILVEGSGRYDLMERLKPGVLIESNFDYSNANKILKLQLLPFIYSQDKKTILTCETRAEIAIEGCN
jgi:hypothetical protein